MPKFLKIVLYTLSAAVLLITLTLIGILLFVDPNDYRDDITTAVHGATGRELIIDGDLELSVFPWLGLSLGRTRLGNAAGFGDQPMAQVEAVDIKVKLLPLLESQLEMKTVQLHGLQLNLARRADGGSNWDDLTGQPAEITETPSEKAPPTSESGPPPLAALAIGGVELSDARIVWDDRQNGQHITIDNLQLQTGALTLGKPVDIRLSLDVETREPALRNHIKFSTRVDIDDALQQLKLSGLRLTIDSQGETLPVSPLNLRLGAEITANLDTQQAAISDLQIDVLGTELRADIRLEQWQNGDARIRIDISDPQALAGLLPPDLSSQLLSESSLTTEASWNLDRQTATVKTLQIKAAGLQIDSNLDATQIIDTPQARGQFSIAEFSPRQLAASANIELPETSDPQVLNKASLSLTFDASPDAIELQKLTLFADDTQLTGTAAVSNFEQPAIRFELAIDGIDVDRYLPPQPDTPPAPVPAGAAVEAAGLPLEPLRALDVDGRISIGKLKAANARLSDILLTIKAKEGQLRLHPLQANLYAGSYAGDIHMDVRSDTPKISLNEVIKNVQAGPLLKDINGDDPISGTANLQAKITTLGSEPEAMMKTLNGSAQVQFLDGSVKGINIGHMLRSAQAKLKGQPAPPEELKQTDFAEVSASVTITDGVVTNKDLSAKTPLLRISGEGTVDLPRGRLDYRLVNTIVNTTTGQAGKDLEQLRGLPIPIRIKGPFDEPKISLDLKSVMSAKAKQKLDQQKKKLKEKTDKALIKEREKAKEKVKEEVDKALKGLFR
ncbi:MAG TPA: AsmA family protein [Gammaproteobacteria bacterium]|nr:AsmA family protein [Gammaproteobacteria bacterium]